MLRSFDGEIPEIDYPCEWNFKLVGRSEEDLRAAVDEVVPGSFSFVPSRASKTGKYLSFELSFTVHDDEERRGIGQRLHDHPAVLFVF